MASKILYVGLDSSQYSNGLFRNGKGKEICVSIFSSNPDDLNAVPYTKRDNSVLEILCNGCVSVSATIDPEKTPKRVGPLVYSAGILTSFYLERFAGFCPKVIQFHFDGPLLKSGREYIKGLFPDKKVVVKAYKKCKNSRDRMKKGGGNRIQPRIVVAADNLANHLFRTRCYELFLDISSEVRMIIPISINEHRVDHTHVFQVYE